MDLLTAVVTILISSPLMAVFTHILNRRARHAEARLQNAEANQKELTNKRDEVAYYRGTIEELVADTETLRLAQDQTDKRYQENTDGLHRKIDDLAVKLDKASQTIEELRQEVVNGNEKSDGLTKELARANKTIDELKQEVKDGNGIITELRKEISKLLVDRAENK